MADQHTLKPSTPNASLAVTRRRFLQGSSLTAAGVLGLLQSPPTQGAPAVASGGPPKRLGGDGRIS
jgi:hypothetical protein